MIWKEPKVCCNVRDAELREQNASLEFRNGEFIIEMELPISEGLISIVQRAVPFHMPGGE